MMMQSNEAFSRVDQGMSPMTAGLLTGLATGGAAAGFQGLNYLSYTGLQTHQENLKNKVDTLTEKLANTPDEKRMLGLSGTLKERKYNKRIDAANASKVDWSMKANNTQAEIDQYKESTKQAEFKQSRQKEIEQMRKQKENIVINDSHNSTKSGLGSMSFAKGDPALGHTNPFDMQPTKQVGMRTRGNASSANPPNVINLHESIDQTRASQPTSNPLSVVQGKQRNTQNPLSAYDPGMNGKKGPEGPNQWTQGFGRSASSGAASQQYGMQAASNVQDLNMTRKDRELLNQYGKRGVVTEKLNDELNRSSLYGKRADTIKSERDQFTSKRYKPAKKLEKATQQYNDFDLKAQQEAHRWHGKSVGKAALASGVFAGAGFLAGAGIQKAVNSVNNG